MEKNWESLTRRIILEASPPNKKGDGAAQKWELCDIEWSDTGDVIEVLASVTADSGKEAARLFREQGFIFGYVKRAGSSISRELDSIL